MTFVDGSTVINADKMNGIVSKVNEIITAVNGGSTPVQETVATPVISISGNTATITCATTGATIYYTTNGNTPTSSSTSGTSPVTVNLTQSCTIKAIAMKSGMTNSSVASQSYTAPSVSVAAPTITLSNGNVVTISAESGATLRYTTDGSTPSASAGTAVSGNTKTITISDTTTVKAVAIKSGGTSSVANKTYTKTSPSIRWTDNACSIATGAAVSGEGREDYSMALRNTGELPPAGTVMFYTEPIFRESDPSGAFVFYNAGSPLSSDTKIVSYPFPKTASEAGGYAISSGVTVPEGAIQFRCGFWQAKKDEFQLYYFVES